MNSKNSFNAVAGKGNKFFNTKIAWGNLCDLTTTRNQNNYENI
jgi:hypothetical protein